MGQTWWEAHNLRIGALPNVGVIHLFIQLFTEHLPCARPRAKGRALFHFILITIL